MWRNNRRQENNEGDALCDGIESQNREICVYIYAHRWRSLANSDGAQRDCRLDITSAIFQNHNTELRRTTPDHVTRRETLRAGQELARAAGAVMHLRSCTRAVTTLVYVGVYPSL